MRLKKLLKPKLLLKLKRPDGVRKNNNDRQKSKPGEKPKSRLEEKLKSRPGEKVRSELACKQRQQRRQSDKRRSHFR